MKVYLCVKKFLRRLAVSRVPLARFGKTVVKGAIIGALVGSSLTSGFLAHSSSKLLADLQKVRESAARVRADGLTDKIEATQNYRKLLNSYSDHLKSSTKVLRESNSLLDRARQKVSDAHAKIPELDLIKKAREAAEKEGASLSEKKLEGLLLKYVKQERAKQILLARERLLNFESKKPREPEFLFNAWEQSVKPLELRELEETVQVALANSLKHLKSLNELDADFIKFKRAFKEGDARLDEQLRKTGELQKEIVSNLDFERQRFERHRNWAVGLGLAAGAYGAFEAFRALRAARKRRTEK